MVRPISSLYPFIPCMIRMYWICCGYVLHLIAYEKFMHTKSEITDVIFYSFGFILCGFKRRTITCMEFQMNRANE